MGVDIIEGPLGGQQGSGTKMGTFLCLLSIGKFAKGERMLGRGLGDVGK